MKTIVKAKYIWLGAIIFVAIILKVALLASGVFPFNSDEAIVALMARHILSGERPIFFYGQAYMGSLDAYLVAVGFWIFGQSIWVIRLVQTLLYSATVGSTFFLGKAIFKSEGAGLISAGLMAVPAVNVTLYTTVSLGGYGEALLIGNLILLIALSIDENSQKIGQYFVLGLLGGLGLWTNGLTLVYLVPAVVYVAGVLIRDSSTKHSSRFLIRGLAAIVPGFLLGSFLLWVFILQKGPVSLFNEYLGSAVSVEGGSWGAQMLQHLVNFVLLGVPAILSFRPPWDVIWLAMPLIPFVLVFWCWIGFHIYRTIKAKREGWGKLLLVSGVGALIILGFLATPFGTDPSGRYFLPFEVILAIMAGGVIVTIKLSRIRWALVVLVLVFNLTGTAQSGLAAPQSFTTQFDTSTVIDHRFDRQLIQFLLDNHEFRGYANYWISYPLAFLSREELIYTPGLPYHQDFRFTTRDDRYSPYDVLVANSTQVAYITAHFSGLDDRIRVVLASNGITWREKEIGDYRVFYALSRPIRPEAMGFVNN